MARAWPTKLRFSAEDKALHAQFDDGAAFAIPFELLRVESPSAEVVVSLATSAKILDRRARITFWRSTELSTQGCTYAPCRRITRMSLS